jgi:two-component system OmpR family response regulator
MVQQDAEETGGAARRQRPPRVLLVEDDSTIADEIEIELCNRGFDIIHVADGVEALGAATEAKFDLLLVDRMLPSLDGISLIETLRSLGLSTPVLVISALGSVDDKVRGLKVGGDDYLTKPFALEELAARCDALLRRPSDTRQTVLRAGRIEMDLLLRTLKRDGEVIELLPRELKLLEYLMRRPDQIVTRAMLLEDVWHYRFVPQTNLVDVHIGRRKRHR